jgi:hypothetical protein
MKKKAIGIVIVFICVTGLATGLALISQKDETPYAFLQGNAGDYGATSPYEFLCQADIGDNKYAVFYINRNNNVSCAIIKKNIFIYKILKISSELSPVSDCGKGNFLYSSYKNGKRREWIDWGVIYDPGIKQVLVNKKKANLLTVKTYDFRLSYFTGDETEKEIPPRHAYVFY